MPWNKPTLTTIVERLETGLESRLTGGVPLFRAALLRILVRVFAMGIYLCYGYIEFLARQLFVMTAEGEYLERLAYMWGISRKAGTYSSGSVRFTGINGTLISSGTIFQDNAGNQYTTTIDGTISGGYVVVTAEALQVGISSNIQVGDEVYFITPVTGIDDLGTVEDEFVGGTDVETDEELRVRVLERIQFPPAGGAPHDYERWAKEVDGVADAWCKPRTPYDGAVTTVIKASGTNIEPTTTLLDAVQDYITDPDRMPATADHFTQGVVEKSISMVVKITPRNTQLETSITDNMRDMLLANAEPGGTIYLASMQDAILRSGVENYEIVSIFVGGIPAVVGDLVFTGYDYPTLYTIQFQSF